MRRKKRRAITIAMATSSKTKVSLKLLIDTNGKRDRFLIQPSPFSHWSHGRGPQETNYGRDIGHLFEGIENLNETYFQPNTSKQCLLNPKAPIGSSDIISPLLLLDEVSDSVAKRFYVCNNSDDNDSEDDEYDQYHPYVLNDPKALCPDCNLGMWREAVYVDREEGEEAELAAGEGGFVKGVVTYMVMDDLVVTPMSAVSSITTTLLNKFNVKEVGALEERVVDIGMPEGLKLLKASLQSKTVLTSVFLGNTGAED